MTGGIMIVPGHNPVLQRMAQHLADYHNVTVFASANALLWEVRHRPPEVVLADVALADMSGAELVEILSNLSPSSKVVLAGPSAPALVQAVTAAKAQLLVPTGNMDHDLWTGYRALGIAPPPPRGTGGLGEAQPRLGGQNVASAPAARGGAVPPPVSNSAGTVAAVSNAASGSGTAVDPVPPAPLRQKAGVDEAVPQATRGPLPVANERAGQPVSGAGGAGDERSAAPKAAAAAPPVVQRPIPASVAQATPSGGGRPKGSAPQRGAMGRGDGGDPLMARPGPMVIRPPQMTAITSVLEGLAGEVGAQSVVMTDTVGMVLLQVGEVSALMLQVVGPLLATSFSTATELSRQLREQDCNSMYLHEGTRFDIYAFNVGYRFLLTLVFDKQAGPSKLGSVWVYAKRATRQLMTILEK
ncbi:MAG: response regulator [Herpetosiphon sp.]